MQSRLMPVTSYVIEGLKYIYRPNYIEKKYFGGKVMEGVLVPTNPLLNMPLTARVTFQKSHRFSANFPSAASQIFFGDGGGLGLYCLLLSV